MLAAFFGVVVVASSVVLWRSISKNQSAQRYLAPQPDAVEPVHAADVDPQRWAIIAPMRTLRRVIHGEIGGLAYGSSTVFSASVAVNAELQHWFVVEKEQRMPSEHKKIVDMLSQQIDALWEQGQWGCQGTLEEGSFKRRLEGLESLLLDAEFEIARMHTPYRR